MWNVHKMYVKCNVHEIYGSIQFFVHCQLSVTRCNKQTLLNEVKIVWGNYNTFNSSSYTTGAIGSRFRRSRSSPGRSRAQNLAIVFCDTSRLIHITVYVYIPMYSRIYLLQLLYESFFHLVTNKKIILQKLR